MRLEPPYDLKENVSLLNTRLVSGVVFFCLSERVVHIQSSHNVHCLYCNPRVRDAFDWDRAYYMPVPIEELKAVEGAMRAKYLPQLKEVA